MKFLLFNCAVAAALVFLFTANRGDVQKIAGQVHDAAGGMKAYANQALKTSQSVKVPDRVQAESETESQRTEVPTPQVTQPTARPAALPAAKAVTPSLAKSPEPLIEPAAPTQPAKNLPVTPKPTTEISKVAPANLNPAVAKRRREILDGIGSVDVSSVPAASVDLKEGSRLMNATERRRELLSLAEEMELLYARSISQ